MGSNEEMEAVIVFFASTNLLSNIDHAKLECVRVQDLHTTNESENIYA